MLLHYFNHFRRKWLGFTLVFLLLFSLEAAYFIVRDHADDGLFGIQIAVAEEQLAGLDAPAELHFVDTAYRRFSVDLAERSDWLMSQKVYLVAGYTIRLPAETEFSFLPSSKQTALNRRAVRRFIEYELAPLVTTAAQDVRISSDDAGIYFDDIAASGREIDITAMLRRVEDAVAAGTTEVVIPYREIAPRVEVDTTLRQMGVQDMLASIVMDYSGSAEGRTHNIHAAAVKISGRLIQPDEEYSFNDALFPLSERFFVDQPVIVGGQFVPELGGGVCQVSSAVFRAALTAGLPITEQSPHSVKIVYYQPPGLDASVYPGQKDLKFRNDTGSAILLQAAAEGQTVRITLYGTPDGRQTAIQGPLYPDGSVVTDVTRYDLSYLWQRELVSPAGEIVTEDYRARYNR